MAPRRETYLGRSQPIPAALLAYSSAIRSLAARANRTSHEVRAERGEVFHLWWHPEDFSYHCDENLGFLRSVLRTFDSYRAQHGMVSVGMAEINSLMQSTQPMCTS